MKTNKIIFWISTGFIALMMINSALGYLTKPEIKAAFVHLGFPGYFRVELAVLKLIGAILLLAPVPRVAKEWTYAGFAFTFVSASIAHIASGDPLFYRLFPVIFLAVLIVSYVTYHRSIKLKEQFNK